MEEVNTTKETETIETEKEPEQNISTLLQNISKVAYAIVQDSPAFTAEIKEDIEEEKQEKASTIEPFTPIEEEEIRPVSAVDALEDKLEIGKPLAFEVGEKYSFQEWLKLSKQQPIVRELDTKKEENQPEKDEKEEIIAEDEKKFQKSLKKKQALIDKFIETNPKIIPTKKATVSPINIELSVQENTSLMTETLAKIYLEQKKYQKAIQAYEILILKYPEKSSFFANQILDIKALQQHNSL
ncbi:MULTISPECIES: tetratricopeptide repeat protein [unclassified Myroides]|uniref:tetratricopeptide repeat protein n=1 Tax=unclassified Myroides TaxID=2642485 RepID=UPI0025767E69|nr:MULTISPECIES: tetratricopeptide repeat protein [unclassified Myroides]